MNPLHLKDHFLSEDDCAALILLIRRYAKWNACPQPVLSTARKTQVAAVSLYAHGRTDDAELLSVIRDRCQAGNRDAFQFKGAGLP